ncbi:aldehyde dehydrogenase [Amycolatopsis sp. H20-H5]|uniref:aldehyde dehydrogenase n=1 Tax=Amycolatopsis sp. H20-H5 TaxID=3046309 RepID=UPI002DBC49CA|nr:aldehyde dehydrogenase [Amycolatopsis sp. H20-H5]MEC3975733.1 aldehyde dehydrogenase [Amycolatopsis sp. H20-H5]
MSLSPLQIDMDSANVFVDGTWTPSHSADRVLAINPATEETIGRAPDGDEQDVDAAVRAARAAFVRADWAKTTPRERAGYLRGMADRLEQRSAEAGEFLTTENGMPIAITAMMNIDFGAAILRYYAGLGDALELEEVRGSTIVRREPVGVAGLIVAWNGPLMLAIAKIAPMLLAGCTAVLKPAGETPLSVAYLIDAAQHAGLPAGVLNVVTGGRETGARLVSHPGVDKIAFTGSTQAGRAIAAACGEQMKPCSLELGGKSAAIILEDADLDHYLAQLPIVSMGGNGQGCVLSTRLLVARPRYDELKGGLRDTIAKLPVGDPHDPATVFGPLAMERQRDKVEDYIRDGKAQGFEVLTGGGRPAGLDRGFYVEPTVFADVDNSSRIAQEEIFGPVVTVTPFDSDEEAVALANDSQYGLGGSVFSTDQDRGVEVARQVRTGTIGVNGYQPGLDAPFGGVKQSGVGREYGPEGLDVYLQAKSIYGARPQG